MKKTIVAILFTVLAIVSQTGCGQPPSNTSNMTLHLQNSCIDNVWVQFYDQSSNAVWPDSTTHWILNKGGTLNETISCTNGDKICYGAAVNGDNTQGYWGDGFGGKLGCTDCCYTCKGGDTTGWSLSCQ